MTARLSDRDLNRVLATWLDEGPMTAADTTMDGVMARIPTVRQRGRIGGWGLRVPQLLRAQAPALASVIVLFTLLAGLGLALGIITRPGPAPSPPAPPPSFQASASPIPSAPVDATPEPAASEAVIAEIRGPVPLRTFNSWVAKSRDPSLGEVRHPGAPQTGVNGYIFTPDSTGRWFTIYLDPTREYGGTETTDRNDLRVLIGWNFSNFLDPEQRGSGSFTSDLGECTLTFETFSAVEIAGAVECVDVPGFYSSGARGGKQTTVFERLVAAFSFDPVLDAYEISTDG